MYHTEALEDVEVAMASKSPLSDDNIEARGRIAQAEQGVTPGFLHFAVLK